MANVTHKKPEPPEEEPSEVIFINPNKDVYRYERPMGFLTVERYKEEAIDKLVRKIVANIEPEFVEMPGFELIRYTLIVKDYRD